MKKENLYKQFTHYEALSQGTSTHAQRVEIYRLMESSGIQVPDETDERLKKGKYPFTCDFFISKHPTAHIIKWVPTRSAEKKSRFAYKDPNYFLDILRGLSATRIDPTNTILEEQAKHVSTVIMKAEFFKLKAKEQAEALVSMLANEGKSFPGYAYDDEPISFSISMVPSPPEPTTSLTTDPGEAYMSSLKEEEDLDLPF